MNAFNPKDFLEIVAPKKPQKATVFLLGTIPASYTSGRPTIQFDGESTVSTRTTYPYLKSYTPTANDRVLLALVGDGAVVLGSIV